MVVEQIYVHIHVTTFNSKENIDLNGKPKTIQLLEEDIGEKFGEVKWDKDFLDIIPRVESIK